MNELHAAKPRAESSPVRFTASGSEYFRIWIANLLLTLLTLGLYHPWARVRKLRYFYGNTWVGDHAFDFHGDPWRMLRGMLLVGLMFVLYGVAGRFSPTAGLVTLLIVSAVSPALFLASLRFRMANTSWRGLRFHFRGSMAGAYRALLPAIVPAVLVLGFTLLIPEVAGDTNALAAAQVEETQAPSQAEEARGDEASGDATEPEDRETAGGPVATRKPVAAPPEWAVASMGIAVLATLALMPWVLWGIKRYQHGHYALGEVQTRLKSSPFQFYLLFLKSAGVSILATVVLAVLVVALAAILGVATLFSGGRGLGAGSVVTIITFVVVGSAGYLALILVSNTYLASRLQNLVWNDTRSPELQFRSELKLLPLMGLTLKNWLLIVLTLGFYWPFAAVASARLKLESVTVHTRGPLDDLTARARRTGAADASGDAAGELFGFDVGL
ncbi:YjgN family protein [Piscinibacter gummiphilus]|uniref:Uncharacterized protein n=1 Tax=Piscinibacter gummiphilus TaxID=946333 RepID=A0A1W6L7J8_9BURK|nr:YjgN family protein [Piscinibacter gummiphilus]ARN20213.1 hypothetical protein A4W93_10035 [Piscinibacter gummiphilus]GLS96489.1 hypothetical protein GCM10007918_37810 [Piscinibacter gummiphilus]